MSMSRMLLDGKAEGRKRALQDDVADLTHIVKSSETLESLVNDILLLSKIQATGFHLDYHTANLSELIEDTMELLGTRAIDRHIELVVTLRLPEFYFEASDLAELLMVRLLWIHCG
jgi:signal transduction histidine kinase